jgi:hypothetical protein
MALVSIRWFRHVILEFYCAQFPLTLTQCVNCGLEADVSLYGGFDTLFPVPVLNYAHVGFRISNAVYTNLFSIAARDQDSPIIQHNVLAELTLPGLDFAGLLAINPIVRLASDLFLNVEGGTMNVDKFGLKYESKEDMVVEWDIKNRGVPSTSGWSDLAPKIVAPLVQSMPEKISFFGSLGPEFGAQVTLLRKYLTTSSRRMKDLTNTAQLVSHSSALVRTYRWVYRQVASRSTSQVSKTFTKTNELDT